MALHRNILTGQSRHQVLQDRNLGGIVILCWVHF
uniref:Uncharacterized protein n=1 Tax=Anguilla anguilla TaxID=7936 RepID=A0A0E9RBE9_ANGAN